MSQIVTPPDIVSKDRVYLIVNVHHWDVEMIMRWLKFSEEKYTIHIYYDEMQEPDWLNKVAKESELIVINLTQTANIDSLLEFSGKIRYVGENQEWPSAAEFLVKNGRNT